MQTETQKETVNVQTSINNNTDANDEKDETLLAETEEPYEQIYGYVQTGNDTYITRHGNARDKIKLLDIEK